MTSSWSQVAAGAPPPSTQKRHSLSGVDDPCSSLIWLREPGTIDICFEYLRRGTVAETRRYRSLTGHGLAEAAILRMRDFGRQWPPSPPRLTIMAERLCGRASIRPPASPTPGLSDNRKRSARRSDPPRCLEGLQCWFRQKPDRSKRSPEAVGGKGGDGSFQALGRSGLRRPLQRHEQGANPAPAPDQPEPASPASFPVADRPEARWPA